MPDKQLVCVQCKQGFVFEEGEQKFFTERGFSEPKRCKGCRQAKKEDRQRQEEAQKVNAPVPDVVIDEYRERFNRRRRGRDHSND